MDGTKGQILRDDGLITIDGEQRKPKFDVQFFDFSAHAGHSELLEFARACNPEKILLCHGDNRELLAADLENDYEVLLPNAGETVEIE